MHLRPQRSYNAANLLVVCCVFFTLLLLDNGSRKQQLDLVARWKQNQINKQRFYQIFNVDDINVLLKPTNICLAQTVAFVHSKNTHFDRRELIRRTWGSPPYSDHMSVVFILGSSNSSHLQLRVQLESAQHSDILLVDTLEDYFNITYKTSAAYQLLSRCRPRLYTHIVKVDDDTVVNPVALQRRIRNIPRDSYTIHCRYLKDQRPHRNVDSKWFVTDEEYPLLTYPRYCYGGGVLFTARVFDYISSLLPSTPFFKVDDVYIFGLVVQFMDIEWSFAPFPMSHNEAKYVLKRAEPVEMALQQNSTQEILLLWQLILKFENQLSGS